MKEIRFNLQTNGNILRIYSNNLPVATAEFGSKNITLNTIFHNQTTTWTDTTAMFDYVEEEYQKFINSTDE